MPLDINVDIASLDFKPGTHVIASHLEMPAAPNWLHIAIHAVYYPSWLILPAHLHPQAMGSVCDLSTTTLCHHLKHKVAEEREQRESIVGHEMSAFM
jgi:hypothetical protein